MENLKKVKGKIKIWNKESIGDLKLPKGDILSKIQFMDSKEEGGGISENERKERMLLKNNLVEIIFKEAISWRQKMKFR